MNKAPIDLLVPVAALLGWSLLVHLSLTADATLAGIIGGGLLAVYLTQARTSRGTAGLGAIALLSISYFAQALTSGMAVSDIIGDSDGLTYHLYAKEVAYTFANDSDSSILNVVATAGEHLGIVAANGGMFWLLGMLYYFLGLEEAVAAFVVLNLTAAVVICHLSVRIAELLLNASLGRMRSFLVPVLLFCNVGVSGHAFLLRKDFILVALLYSAVFFGLRARFISAIICSFGVGVLRLFFAPICVGVLVFRFLPRKLVALLTVRRMTVLTALLFLIIALLPGSFLRQIGLVTVELETSQTGLVVSLGGSALFASNPLLQWVYVLLYPFPPLSPMAYGSPVAILSLTGFLLNGYLLAGVYLFVRRAGQADTGLAAIFSVWCALSLMLALNLASAAAANMFGVVEPRYKMAWWVASCILLLLAKSLPERRRWGRQRVCVAAQRSPLEGKV